ncbi:hypothetical protein L2744_09400 [Shewanella profunda]|uniref:hypothetical protein n=1 Tax=Shewanella profunda TaxID=254793 RepID=UPI00200CAEBD|nr:hypothetical protein [Shewanella profunda]MCL1089819.1 hypothetical protein [Shewanella profunda]
MGWLSKFLGSSERDFDVGYYEEYSLGFFVNLIHKYQGWYLWKIQNGDSVGLMLIKPAIGELPPIPVGLVWCFGGKGFYGYINKSIFSERDLYLSFYGSQKYRGSTKCLFKNQLLDSLTEESFIKMDESQVRFEVTTAPVKHRSGSSAYRLEQGIVDFTGSKAAFDTLNIEWQKLVQV